MEVTHSLRPPAAGRTTGITTSAGTTSLSYDYEGRVTGITYPSSATNSFSYNVLDARVGKVDSAGTWSYKRDGAGVTDGVLSDGFATYTPGVSRHASSTTTFEGGDYLGTNRVETNASQAVSGTRVYDAFGNLESTTGSPAGPFGYLGQAGYNEDGDSGLKLLGHRYYDPSTGRFLTRDPSQDGRNWYGYCDNDPAFWTDSQGLETFAGNTWGYPWLAHLAPGNWSSHTGLSAKEVMKIIEETNDDSIGIWGHGRSGAISVNRTESLNAADIRQIGDYRRKHHKKKFVNFMVNECDVFSDADMLKACLEISGSVQGYTKTCYGLSYQRTCWTSQ